jgi:hypothetical protein
MKIGPGTLSHLCHCFLFGLMMLSASFSHMVAVCFIRRRRELVAHAQCEHADNPHPGKMILLILKPV